MQFPIQVDCFTPFWLVVGQNMYMQYCVKVLSTDSLYMHLFGHD